MKINWGTGIVIAFVLFISFIMYFVVNMIVNDKYDHDLVTENYYQEELKHQEEIDKLKNAKVLEHNVSWEKTENGLEIKFPENLVANKITGKVFLYRPSNQKLDSETTISLSDNIMLIPKQKLLDGRWNIIVDWQYNGVSYLYKQDITY